MKKRNQKKRGTKKHPLDITQSPVDKKWRAFRLREVDPEEWWQPLWECVAVAKTRIECLQDGLAAIRQA